MNNPKFEKELIKAIPNFDETKIWFERGKKLYEPTYICFSLGGKLKKIRGYKHQETIDIWKHYLIEWLDTGIFDPCYYWKASSGKNKVYPAVYRIPLDFSETIISSYSEQFQKFMSDFRKENGDTGFTPIPKPTDMSNVIEPFPVKLAGHLSSEDKLERIASAMEYEGYANILYMLRKIGISNLEDAFEYLWEDEE